MARVRTMSSAWLPNFCVGKLHEERPAQRCRDVWRCNIKIYLKRTMDVNSDWIRVHQGRVHCLVLLNTVIKPSRSIEHR
jgi:hypothetical protein